MTDITQLLKEFERFAYGQSLHSAFTDLLNWTLLPFKMHDNVEAQQHALETYQTHPKATQLVALLTLIGDSSEGFADRWENYINKQFRMVTTANFGLRSTCAT